jgi:membrane protease YdiL (CAAX protease family)
VATASHEQQALRIILFVLFGQGIFVAITLISDPRAFIANLGFAPGLSGSGPAWALACVIAVLYVWSARSIGDVREHMFRPSGLKAVAVVTALVAGIVEEVIFRRWVMDYLDRAGHGVVVQVVASGLTFGLVHLLWGIRNLAAGVNAAVSTSLLGFGLAVVYIVGDRSLAPCIVAHFVISALIEPGLVLAAVGDKLGYWRERMPLSGASDRMS